jgi:activator of HSP90 ATPase
MTRTIEQHAVFRAPAKTIFDLYMDSQKHTAATGAPAKLSRKAGSAWYAHGGAIGGKNLLIVPEKLIVQSWRAKHWKKDELSILTLRFSKALGGTRLDLVHVGVPQHDQKGVRQGWPKYYWKPWKKYLAARKKT